MIEQTLERIAIALEKLADQKCECKPQVTQQESLAIASDLMEKAAEETRREVEVEQPATEIAIPVGYEAMDQKQIDELCAARGLTFKSGTRTKTKIKALQDWDANPPTKNPEETPPPEEPMETSVEDDPLGLEPDPVVEPEKVTKDMVVAKLLVIQQDELLGGNDKCRELVLTSGFKTIKELMDQPNESDRVKSLTAIWDAIKGKKL